ncbi:MAG TPA: SDR family oxidoreductase [Candidatus Bathyarchaeia archaeon]|nr:SDR family oxidoreductase [Candidatus Bathyarchaeia archaeon]
MEKRFDGKHVIVTGASAGIGKAIAQRFAAEGAEVLLLSRRKNALEDAVKSMKNEKAWYLLTDVSKIEDCEHAVAAAIQRWKQIDVLINNAGIDNGGFTPFLKNSYQLWEQVINTNLRGAFVMSQLVAQNMIEHGGVILNNSSIAGITAEPGAVAYNCSKAGLISLTQTMAIELAPYKIRVNCVSPGWTLTEMTTNVTSSETLKYLNTNFERVPMRRLVLPEEIAATFAFLASNDASGITGQNIIIDGGTTANLYTVEVIAAKDPVIRSFLSGERAK